MSLLVATEGTLVMLTGAPSSVLQGEGVQQLREALKILAERVLILEHMIGVHGEGVSPHSSSLLAAILRLNSPMAHSARLKPPPPTPWL